MMIMTIQTPIQWGKNIPFVPLQRPQSHAGFILLDDYKISLMMLLAV